MSIFGARAPHRGRGVALLGWAAAAAVGWAGPAHAHDRRAVTEPSLPRAACALLEARLAAPRGVLSPAAEAAGSDTARIQAAIDGCRAGQAVELRPRGARNVFLTGPLRLRVGVTLVVWAGAALFASRNPRDYDVEPGSCGVVQEKKSRCQPLILADGAPGSGIMGEGAIDGRGGAPLIGLAGTTFWELAREAKVKDLSQACPRLVTARESDGFTLYGITLRNAANAHVVVERTHGFTAWGVKIATPRTARNTDGINPVSSSDVTIAHCSIDTGDDNVAIKTGPGGPVAHVDIVHNHFYAGHGMSIGSDTSGGVSDVHVTDLTLDGTDHGIRIKSDRSRGGLVERVSYEDVCLREVGNPILLDTRYTAFPGDKIPVYRDIVLRDVHSLTAGGLAFLGFDEAHRLGVTLDNVTVAEPIGDLRAEHAEIAVGPRAGNLRPAGTDVTLAEMGKAGKPDGGGASSMPASAACEGRFVPFESTTTAPAAAVRVPAADATLYVAASGTGDYYSIQRAIDVAPARGAVISIGPGVYRERLRIGKPALVLRSPYPDAARTVVIAGESAATTGNGLRSATVEVTAEGFRAENLTFANDYTRTHPQQPVGSQALALLVTGDRAVFRNVRLLGHQDTLYAGSPDCTPPPPAPTPSPSPSASPSPSVSGARRCTPSRQYFADCYVEGNVDFIYGNGVTVFDRCEVHSLPHSIGYLTAQGRLTADEPSLFVFNRCRLTAEPEVAHVWLGRPWRPFARVVFLETEMGAHIEPAGFREWHPGETTFMDTVSYAEFHSLGPGAHPPERDPHVKALTAVEAGAYSTRRVLAGDDGWSPALLPPRRSARPGR